MQFRWITIIQNEMNLDGDVEPERHLQNSTRKISRCVIILVLFPQAAYW